MQQKSAAKAPPTSSLPNDSNETTPGSPRRGELEQGIRAVQRAIADLKRAEGDFRQSRQRLVQRFERDAAGQPGAAAPPKLPNVLRRDYEAFLYYFIALGGLRRDHAVLDVGCGRGRAAEQLAPYLSPDGHYDGFDVRRDVIERLQRRIGSKHPHCRFHHADIYNKSYNPGGTIAPRDCIFPFDRASFDFVFVLSVFTHLLPADMDHYLSEIARVLKVGCCSLVTFFLLNEESTGLIDSGAVGKTFAHRGEHSRYQHRDVPERAVAVDEDFVRGMYRRHGLKILDPICCGRWCGRRGPRIRQDIVVAVKE